MFDYKEIQDVATELLTEFKQGVIQLIIVTPGSGPAHKPGPAIETPVTLVGAVARGIKLKYVTLGLGIASDYQVTHNVQEGATPQIGGHVLIDGVKYKIKNIIAKPGAGVVVAYTLIVSKGA